METIQPERSVHAILPNSPEERLRRHPGIVLTPEFAETIHGQIDALRKEGKLPNEFPLASLIVPWHIDLGKFIQLDVLPPQEWVDFMGTLSREQTKALVTLVRGIMLQTSVKTMGEIQDRLKQGRKVPGAGDTGLPFLEIALGI